MSGSSKKDTLHIYNYLENKTTETYTPPESFYIQILVMILNVSFLHRGFIFDQCYLKVWTFDRSTLSSMWKNCVRSIIIFLIEGILDEWNFLFLRIYFVDDVTFKITIIFFTSFPRVITQICKESCFKYHKTHLTNLQRFIFFNSFGVISQIRS